MCLISIRLDSLAVSSYFTFRSHLFFFLSIPLTFSSSFVQPSPLAPSPPCRPSFSPCRLIRLFLLHNEIQMSLLDPSVLLWDQKDSCNLIKITTFSHYHTPYLLLPGESNNSHSCRHGLQFLCKACVSMFECVCSF